MRRTPVAVLALCLSASVTTACTDGDGAADTSLTVFAASSLTETYGQLEKAFEHNHSGVDVVISFGSSSALAEQLTQGAPADVVATADEESMSQVVDAGLVAAEPQPFASNTLTIVTPPDNPAGIQTLDDLGSADFVMCDESAPCGAAGQRFLDNAGSAAAPRSFEADVKSVLSKVVLGEADAGLVYVTDAKAAGADVHRVPIPADVNVTNAYYIAAVKGSGQADVADDWIALVESRAGQDLLRAAGFGPP